MTKKTIEEICGNPYDTGLFSRRATLRILFRKNKKKTFSRYGLGECVSQISGLYRFSFGQEVPYKPKNRQTNTHTRENRNILDRLPASR